MSNARGLWEYGGSAMMSGLVDVDVSELQNTSIPSMADWRSLVEDGRASPASISTGSNP